MLGLPVPESDSLLEGLPEQVKASLTSTLKEINSIYARENVPADDYPEAIRIAERVFSKYGITINSVEQLDDE